MAIARHYQIDVGTSATALEGTQYPGWRLHNNGANTVYIGDSSVTTTDGFPVASGEPFVPQDYTHKSLRGQSGDRLYGVVASSTEDVRVIVEARVNP